MKKTTPYSLEVCERAVRMVLEHLNDYPSQWAAFDAIVPTLHGWVRRQQTDAGQRPGPTSSEERERIKLLERENREMRKANEILRWPVRILPRRSSTAAASPEGLCRSIS